MKINYNYISCIESKKKPDIYIGGKINLPAKNYRFADMNKKEAKKYEEININEFEEKDNLKEENNKNKSYSDLSTHITGIIIKSKDYKNEGKENSNIIDLSELEITEQLKSLDNDIEQLRKKGQKYESDGEGIHKLHNLI